MRITVTCLEESYHSIFFDAVRAFDVAGSADRTGIVCSTVLFSENELTTSSWKLLQKLGEFQMTKRVNQNQNNQRERVLLKVYGRLTLALVSTKTVLNMV